MKTMRQQLSTMNARKLQAKDAKALATRKALHKLQRHAEGGDPGAGGDPKTYTQEELNAAVEKAKAEAKEENDKLFNEKWNKQYAKYKEQEQKKIDEAKRLAEMTATERAEHERDEMKKELEALKAANTRSEMKKEARSILKEANCPVSEEILDVLVTTDAEATKKAIEAYAAAFNTAREDAVKDALKGHTPKTSKGEHAITKEDIMKVKDRRERQRLINENIDLFR
jgi:hypothetical protein